MRSTTPLALLVAMAFTTGACSDLPAPVTAPDSPNFIVNGAPTGSAYGSVGAMLVDVNKDGVLNGDDEFCTGSLISPTVFLTAAHCMVTRYTPAGTQIYVSFAPDLYAKGIKTIAATGFTYDPLFGHDQANLNDLAVIILPAGSTKGLTPYKLATAGELGVLSAKGALADAIFINVGYGTSATRTGVPGFGYDGVRKFSESEFMALQPYWLGLLMNTSATGLGGDCYGDSGGPKFLKTNPGVVYATVTTGDYVCRATSWDYRTDTQSARDFLGQFVTLP